MNWNNETEYPNTTVVTRATFTDPPTTPPSVAIPLTLAELEDAPPSRTTFTLADEIDPDALDDLVTGDTDEVGVTFTIDDYLVVVRSDGYVQIRTAEE